MSHTTRLLVRWPWCRATSPTVIQFAVRETTVTLSQWRQPHLLSCQLAQSHQAHLKSQQHQQPLVTSLVPILAFCSSPCWLWFGNSLCINTATIQLWRVYFEVLSFILNGEYRCLTSFPQKSETQQSTFQREVRWGVCKPSYFWGYCFVLCSSIKCFFNAVFRCSSLRVKLRYQQKVDTRGTSFFLWKSEWVT